MIINANLVTTMEKLNIIEIIYLKKTVENVSTLSLIGIVIMTTST